MLVKGATWWQAIIQTKDMHFQASLYYNQTMENMQNKLNFEITKYTPYLILM